ncbi:putative RDD family membrane protein YckC [Brevibacillus sp. AG162]|uniref:RDD family protein n=1 Tax=Brevibacillus sp. AG162 TaxID=2572910 RepID=UPI00114E81D3|nr:RDD family protein [Brevibacillus sp. AG162]TQK74845.1 putative RDD family membrane protein YckC [Brevibacillus sp. AG162]
MNEPTYVSGSNREASVVTPEHVMLRFQTAGLGSRATAMLIDTGILLLVNLTVFIMFGIVLFGNEDDFFLDSDNYVLAIVLLVIFVVNFGYYWLLEAFWGGQTVGKRLVGIRVIRDNGQPATFVSSTIRNLFRIVDAMPSGYFLGALVCFFHPRDKRIGDMVAGTIVVVESGQRSTLFQKKKDRQSNGFDLNHALLVLDERQKQAITREDWQLLSSFISRLSSLTQAKKYELGNQIASIMRKKLDLFDEQTTKEDPILFLQRLYNQLQNEFQLRK